MSSAEVPVKALILAGGLGTRLRALFPELPKPLAPVLGRPFLEWQIELLVEQGFTELVLCLGHRGEQIVSHFADGARWGARIEYSLEPEALGTAGALRHAARHLERTVLVVNGDTFLRADYRAVVARHRALVDAASAVALSLGAPSVASPAIASLCLVEEADTRAYGRVLVGPDARVTGFEEKSPAAGAGLVNAGVYLLEPEVLAAIPRGRPASLEREVFPGLALERRLFALPVPGPFVDMGTPDGHARLEAMLAGPARGG